MDRELFVKNVKRFCRAKGVAPTVACRESGAGSSFMTGIKNGNIPSIEKVELLANYLDCTVNDLLGTPNGKDPLREWWNSLPEETKKSFLYLSGAPEDLI